MPALETLRVYRSLAGLGSGYRERGHPRYSGLAQCACSRCRRLRSSGTLAAISPAPETLRVYRRLRQRLQGCGDSLDIPALLNARVAAPQAAIERHARGDLAGAGNPSGLSQAAPAATGMWRHPRYSGPAQCM
ncbi:hypothetical protein EMIT0196P_130031 [Pseudomonas chlororaphis]